MFIIVLICVFLFATTFVDADTDNTSKTQTVLSFCVLNDLFPKHKLVIDHEFEGYDIT